MEKNVSHIWHDGALRKQLAIVGSDGPNLEKISPNSGLSDPCINFSMTDTLEKYVFSKLWTDEAVIEVLTEH